MRFKLPLAFIALTTSTLSAQRPRKGTSMTAFRDTLSGLPSAAAMALGFGTFVPANPALAATFANTDAATITIAGRIDQGDEQKFFAARGYAPNFRKLVVNSPGGSILPAIIIGKGLRTSSYEVQVAESGECGSACTLLLAAAAERSAYSSSRIAVHSASTFEADGTRKPETDDDLAVSAKLARHMTEWGTPAVIIGKMIGTGQRPSDVERTDPLGPLHSASALHPAANALHSAAVHPTAAAGRYALEGPAHLRLRARLRGNADGEILRDHRIQLAYRPSACHVAPFYPCDEME